MEIKKNPVFQFNWSVLFSTYKKEKKMRNMLKVPI